MDLKDKKLVYLLDLNSREKETNLAKQLKTSKQVINYRIRKLESEGFIKTFQTVFNLESLGIGVYANVYFKLSASKAKEKEIIDFLLNNNLIGYVASLGGKFDLSIVLVAKTIQQLEDNLNKIINKYPNDLKEYAISLRTYGIKFPKKYLSEASLESKKILTKEKHSRIDDLDKKILKILSSNSRTSIVEISEKLKIPFSTVRIRIYSLENRGIIAGYSILPNLEKMGMLNYKVFIRTKDKSGEASKKLLSFAEDNKNITWFFKTLGDHDYEFRVEVENQQKYQELLKELRSQFPLIIDDIETVMIFNELKENYAVILESV